MCGEMAGDSVAIPLLLGLGLDEFSMSASSILKARSQIKQLNKAEMEQLAKKALTFQTADEVVALVKKETRSEERRVGKERRKERGGKEQREKKRGRDGA